MNIKIGDTIVINRCGGEPFFYKGAKGVVKEIDNEENILVKFYEGRYDPNCGAEWWASSRHMEVVKNVVLEGQFYDRELDKKYKQPTLDEGDIFYMNKKTYVLVGNKHQFGLMCLDTLTFHDWYPADMVCDIKGWMEENNATYMGNTRDRNINFGAGGVFVQ